MDWLGVLIFGVLAFGVGVGALLFVLARRRREARDQRLLAEAREQQLHLPPTLHPVIDPEICIGSLACIAACPEGDILGLVDGRAALIAGSACIGHGRCAAECPVGAIRLVFGTSERGVDLPEIDTSFESSRPGVHIVGELGGMGLIKNAITQGVQVANVLAQRLGKDRANTLIDVVIVGAGPAGVATAVACRAAGLTFAVLEQDAFGGTITNYPRHKVVMTERVALPGFGLFGKKSLSKEQLLASWQEVLNATGVEVQERVRVTAIDGTDGSFTVQTSNGPIMAHKVVLAMGRRGTPRRLEVPGEELEKVSYRLLDPDQYRGKKVLIVGGGDSALEAAIALAAVPHVTVGISYRNPAFGRCRPQNRDTIATLMTDGRVVAYLGTQVVDIKATGLTLEAQDGSRQVIANDYVIINIGGTLPDEFLKQAGVVIRRHHGEMREAQAERAAKLAKKARRDEPGFPWLGVVLTLVGAAVIVALYLHGERYYWLDKAARLKSPLHQSLRPAGLFGHGVGVAATAVMLMNFFYALRKRTTALRHWGSLRTWLTFHVFVGVLSPLVIAFHAAFHSNNLLATATSAALALVVGTGLIGRFVFAFIPAAGGRLLGHQEIERRWQKLAADVRGFASQSTHPDQLEQLAHEILTPPKERRSLVLMLLRAPLEPIAAHWRAHRARRLFPSRQVYRTFRRAFLALRRTRVQMAFYERVRRFMSAWRIVHVVLSIFLVLVIILHIALSVYLGYRWIFT